MDYFVVYDLILLGLFVLFISFFLYIKRDNLKRDGILFLYRTKWGIKLINRIGVKYQRTLKVLSYFSIVLGYFLMAGMVYMFGRMVWLYMFTNITDTIKIIPIAPLVPYIDKMVDIGLPPFYFTYWIIILAVIAIVHEFSHGIFAIYNKVKIKTTGFGFFPYFLPIFPLAFVELDEKKMAKKSRFSQMAILSAGTFANVLTAIFFVIVLWIFFSLAFAPAGITFDSYSYSPVSISSISMINGIILNSSSYDIMINAFNETGLNKIKADNQSYLITKKSFESQKNNQGYIAAYDDAPAINSLLNSIILEVNGKKTGDLETFRKELAKYSPGENITLKTLGNETEEKEITLAKNPKNESLPFLGIAFIDRSATGITGKLQAVFSSFRKPNVYYEPKFNGINIFVYNLLWWLILISISVALVNMLPMGIFDGGRFFYLTLMAITKKEKIAKKIVAYTGFFLFFLLALIMFFWALSFFR
jgi:membrane-associated protease RseP (regulator of RpoE activity)